MNADIANEQVLNHIRQHPEAVRGMQKCSINVKLRRKKLGVYHEDILLAEFRSMPQLIFFLQALAK